MANIHKQQQTSDYAHRYYSAEGNFGQKMLAKGEEYEREAEKHEAKAQNKYATYLDLMTQDKFNDFATNPDLMGNPEALKREMSRVRDDMASGVKDDDVKTAYLANTDKIIGQYTERSAIHQAKLREKEKAAQEAQAKAYQKQLNKYQQAALANQFDFAAAELSQEFSSNPAELMKNLDKLGADIASTMKDDKEKLTFLTSVELKKNSLVKAAQSNQFKATEELKQATNAEIVKAATDDINLINQNIWSGNYDDADLVNLSQAHLALDEAMYATNPDGTYMFSEKEREQAKAKVDKSIVDGFKAYHASLPTWKRKKVEDNILKSKGEIEMNGYGLTYVKSSSLNEMKDYIRDFRKNVKEDEDAGYTPEEATKRAVLYSATMETLNNMKSAMYGTDNKGKITSELKGSTKVTDMLDYRKAVQKAYTDDIIKEKDYRKLFAETVNPTLRLMEKYEPEKGLPDPNLGFVYRSVMMQVDPNNTMNTQQKLYFMQQVYDQMLEQGVDPNEKTFRKNDPRLANISKGVIADYVKQSDPAVLGKDIDSVVLGTNIYSYGEGAGTHNISTTARELRKAPDGSIWAIQRDSAGNIINKIRVR